MAQARLGAIVPLEAALQPQASWDQVVARRREVYARRRLVTSMERSIATDVGDFANTPESSAMVADIVSNNSALEHLRKGFVPQASTSTFRVVRWRGCDISKTASEAVSLLKRTSASKNLGAALDQLWEQMHQPVPHIDGYLQGLDQKPRPRICHLAGMCLCDAAGKRLRAMKARMDTAVKKLFVGKALRGMLRKSLICLRFTSCGTPDQPPEQLWGHVSLQYFKPWRSTMQVVYVACDSCCCDEATMLEGRGEWRTSYEFLLPFDKGKEWRLQAFEDSGSRRPLADFAPNRIEVVPCKGELGAVVQFWPPPRRARRGGGGEDEADDRGDDDDDDSKDNGDDEGEDSSMEAHSYHDSSSSSTSSDQDDFEAWRRRMTHIGDAIQALVHESRGANAEGADGNEASESAGSCDEDGSQSSRSTLSEGSTSSSSVDCAACDSGDSGAAPSEASSSSSSASSSSGVAPSSVGTGTLVSDTQGPPSTR